jgi:hypothetical protein
LLKKLRLKKRLPLKPPPKKFRLRLLLKKRPKKRPKAKPFGLTVIEAASFDAAFFMRKSMIVFGGTASRFRQKRESCFRFKF